MRKQNIDFQDDAQVEEINISPLIDVVFILLIFFILTMAFSDKLAMDIDVPQASNASAKSSDFLNVSISKSGEIFLQEQPCSLSILPERIKALHKDKILIYTDKSVRGDKLMAVIDSVKSVSGVSIYLATQKKCAVQQH